MKITHLFYASIVCLLALSYLPQTAHADVIGDGHVALPVVVWIVDENGKAIKGATVKLLNPPTYKTLLEGFAPEAIREAENGSVSNNLGFAMVYIGAPYSTRTSAKEQTYKVILRGEIEIRADGYKAMTVDLKKEVGEYLASQNVAPYLTIQLRK